MGLTDPAQKVNAIVQRVLSLLTIEVGTEQRNAGIRNITLFRLTIDLDTEDESSYNELLSLNEAFQLTEPTRNNPIGFALPWLEWVLLEGSSIVVPGFRAVSSPVHGRFSRSGGDYLMYEGGSFQIPPQHQGDASNNFLTRSLARANAAVRNILTEEADNLIRRATRRNIL